MIVLQLVVWLDAVRYHSSWCATCIRCTTSASGSMHSSSRRQPHTAWGGRSAPVGALPPYPPKVFFSTLYIERYTHITSNHKKPPSQLGKNISPTRKIEKAHSCKPCKPCKHQTWYGEGTELVRRRSRLTPFVLFCSNHHFPLFYFVLFCSSCSKT